METNKFRPKIQRQKRRRALMEEMEKIVSNLLVTILKLEAGAGLWKSVNLAAADADQLKDDQMVLSCSAHGEGKKCK
jgi:hypothetical protein